MDPVERSRVVAGRGLTGNANQGGRRQITLIEREIWERLMHEVGAAGRADRPGPSSRRANVMVRGLSLADSRERILRLGEVRVRVLGETKPCERMDEAWPGLREAMFGSWRGGAFGEVLDDGEIRVGDPVAWSEG